MRLLLAEDEKALSKALTTILERNNYSVDAVFDGQEALEYLEADNYDCVILDIMMPKVDGITVLKEIRKKGSLIPVLMLTAKSEVDDKVLGLDAGANDYLTILLDNALKYSEDGGQILVRLEKEKKRIRLSVYNTTEFISRSIWSICLTDSTERIVPEILRLVDMGWGFLSRQRRWKRTEERSPHRRKMRNL